MRRVLFGCSLHRMLFARVAPFVVAVMVLIAWSVPAGARAADAVYWENQAGNKISFANLDGSGGGDLITGATTPVYGRVGLALDPATDKVYWVNQDQIAFVNLDGSGGGNVNTTGATVGGITGVALDPGAGRIYWANYTGNKISYANLDGSGGGDLDTTGATVVGPGGVAVDPVAGKLYWANSYPGADTISYANLDGSGGGNLTTTGATNNVPVGVAVDPAAGKIYWANLWTAKISYANLDGSGGGDLNTTGATVAGAEGVAIDPVAGRVYWASRDANKISYANLNGSGGADVVTAGATTNLPAFPAVVTAPASLGTNTISGDSGVGSDLSCSAGPWARDIVSAFFYRAPRSIGFQWLRDGTDIAGATNPSYSTTTVGSYTCRVTATNHAGSSAQTSGALILSGTPIATTGTARVVNPVVAELHAAINPQYAATSYHFDYGTTTAYGSRVPASDIAVGADGNDHAVSQRITSLEPNRTYHFRVVAANSRGTSRGSDQTFTTVLAPPPRISALRLSPVRFRAERRGPSILTRGTTGTKVQYRLSERATVTFTIQQILTGRRKGKSCLPDTPARHKLPRCTRFLPIKGSFNHTAPSGRVTFRFTGRLANAPLKPGTYRLVAVSRSSTGHLSAPASVNFTIRR